MASFKDLRSKLERIKSEIPAVLDDVAEIVSNTAKGVAERAIKDQGFGEYYREVKVPAWFLTGKELNQDGAAFINKKKEKKELTNWKELREAQGLQTGHVDLTYSEEMWRGMFGAPAVREGDRHISYLGHNNKEGQNKMNWNRDRYGDFIRKVLTGDRFDVLIDTAKEEIIRLIKERT